MSSFALQKPQARPSLIIFVALQMLDVLTTMIGLKIGASEGSFFIGGLMRLGPFAGLLIAKIFAVLLVTVALKFRRPRVVIFLNYWSAAVVSWNLIMILMSGFRGR